MVSNNKKNYNFFFYLVGMCLLLLIRDVIEVNIPLLVFFCYFSAGYCFATFDQCLAISSVLPLLNHGVQTNYIIFVAIVMYVIRFRRSTRINYIHATAILLSLYELMHAFILPFDVAEYLRYVFFFIYIGLILGESRIQELMVDESIVLKTFIFMDAYFMFEVLLVTVKYMSYSTIISSGFRFGTLEDYVVGKPTLFDNENMVGLFALIAIGLLLIQLHRNKKHRILKIAMIVYFLFFGLMTTSKTFIICFAMMFAMFLLYMFRTSIIKATGIMLASVTALLIAANTIFASEVQRLMVRFQAADLSTGRNDLIKYYNKFIFSDWKRAVFGIGLQEVVEKSGAHNSPHNATQELILCWGIIGLLVILLLAFRIYRKTRKDLEIKPEIVYYLPAIMFLIFIQTIQFIRLTSIFGLVIVLYVAILSGGRRRYE